MEREIKQRLTSKNVWTRALFMVLFAIAYGLVEIVLTLVVVVQFFIVLLTGGANEPLLKFGTNLGRYIYQIIQFQTFNSEDKPFPFSDWPEDEVYENQWLGDLEGEEAANEDDQPAASSVPDTVPEDAPDVEDNETGVEDNETGVEDNDTNRT